MHGVGQKSLACFGYCLVSFCVLGSLETNCLPSNPFLSCCGLVIECDGEKYLTQLLFLLSFIHCGIYIYIYCFVIYCSVWFLLLLFQSVVHLDVLCFLIVRFDESCFVPALSSLFTGCWPEHQQ